MFDTAKGADGPGGGGTGGAWPSTKRFRADNGDRA